MHPHRLAGGCDHGRMTAWRDVEQAEPEFAQRVRALFDAKAQDDRHRAASRRVAADLQNRGGLRER
jgi:hypothetical protein